MYTESTERSFTIITIVMILAGHQLFSINLEPSTTLDRMDKFNSSESKEEKMPFTVKAIQHGYFSIPSFEFIKLEQNFLNKNPTFTETKTSALPSCTTTKLNPKSGVFLK